ncbi:nucleoside hydrolase [Paenibacillus sp. R14(2021)]|uniref:nucleoside hydrolase n=1 Tax=Paenibacillus sp. R14(2021) TaxID=2859228 RepID=UPI001C611B2B|nr:nucleoside hydrolase [Paenibacillus sp. R14(2021)]
MNKTRMIIDVDTGIDDAIAILYAVLAPDIHVEGITTCFGNIDVDQATDNTLRLLKLARANFEIPVAVGASKPLKRDFPGSAEHVHGKNGIGGAVLAKSEQQPIRQSAAEFIVSTVNDNPGEITIVTLARMTNLAHAIQLDPGIITKIKEVVVMGGNVFVPGNITPVAEANLAGDPEAAAYAFASGLPITAVGLDVTLKTLLTKAHVQYMLTHAPAGKQPLVAFMRDSLEHYFDFYQEVSHLIGACPMHDLLAVMVAADPSLVKKQTLLAVIETEGLHTSGMVVTDRRAVPVVGNPIDFCVDVESERALNAMMALFLRENAG